MYLKGGISMRKTLKRTLSLFLAVLLICTVLTVAPFSAGALNGTVAGTINANSNQTVYVQGANIKFLKFVPDKDMAINFYSQSSYDPHGYICDADYNLLAENDEITSGNHNFGIKYFVSANVTYYLGFKYYYSKNANLTVYLDELPEWKHSDGVITEYNGNKADLVIPSEIDGETITRIDASVFKGHTEINTLTIPDTITNIGDEAFDGCTGLTTINFSNTGNLKTIGKYAFNHCDMLKDVELPEGLESFGMGCFNYCGSTYQDKSKGLPGYFIIPSSLNDAGTTMNNSSFLRCCFSTMIFKTKSGRFDQDFDRQMGVGFFACYKPSDAYSAITQDTMHDPQPQYANIIKDPYTVTYDDGIDKEGVDITVPAAQTSEEGDLYITLSDYVPDGGTNRKFLGWAFSPNASTPWFAPGTKTAFGSDVTLYAVWENTLNFVDGEEVVYTTKIKYNDFSDYSGLTYSGVRTYADGKVLMGYYSQPDGQGDYLFHCNARDSVKRLGTEGIAALWDAADENGIINTYAYWKEKPQITGQSISLDGDVSMNLFIQLPENTTMSEFDSALLTLTSNNYYNSDASYYGKTDINLQESEQCTDLGNGLYKVTLKLYFKEMADEFEARITFNETECDVKDGFSVRNYANSIINGDQDEYLKTKKSYTEDDIAELKELLKSMLNLGGKAQTEFNYNTADLASEGLNYSAPAVDISKLSDPAIPQAVDTTLFHATAANVTDTRIYFINKLNWDKVQADFELINPDGSGQNDSTSYEMTKTGETYSDYDYNEGVYKDYEIYSCVLPSGFDEPMHFSNGQDQITETTYSIYYGYNYYPGSFSGTEDGNTVYYLDCDSSFTGSIALINSQGWENVYVWATNGDCGNFPGEKMTFLNKDKDNNDVYVAPQKGSTVVFSDGTMNNRSTPVSYYTSSSSITPSWRIVPGDVLAPIGVSYEGSSIGLLNQMAYSVYLRDHSATNLKVFYQDEELEPEELTMNGDDGYRRYKIVDIPAAKILNDIELDIQVEKATDAVTGVSTDNQAQTVSFNMQSYIKRALQMRGSKYDSLKATVTALYDFGQKAKEFFD